MRLADSIALRDLAKDLTVRGYSLLDRAYHIDRKNGHPDGSGVYSSRQINDVIAALATIEELLSVHVFEADTELQNVLPVAEKAILAAEALLA